VHARLVDGTGFAPVADAVHAEHDAEQLRRWAQAGVTTVRDLSPRELVSFRARTDALNADPRNATPSSTAAW